MKKHLLLLLIVFATAMRVKAGVTNSSAVGSTVDKQETRPVSDHAWLQVSAADLSVPGPKTVSLARCEPGVTGSEPDYYIYISGTNSPEAVKVSGGTCKGDGAPGTLQFTTARGHSAGYTISSASDGLQEALIASRFVPTNPTGRPQTTRVTVPPGELKAFARISIRVSGTTVDFSGSILECYMADSCIYVGDPVNSNIVSDVTLINPKGRPMVVNGSRPFIDINVINPGVSTRADNSAAAMNSMRVKKKNNWREIDISILRRGSDLFTKRAALYPEIGPRKHLVGVADIRAHQCRKDEQDNSVSTY